MLLTLLLLASPAFAEDSSLCPPATKIKASYGQSCHQNSVFAQSAVVCLKRLQAREALLQAQLTAQLAAQVALADGQAEAMAGQVASLTALSSSLGTLSNDANGVKEELLRYSANFTLPAGVSPEQAKSLGLTSYFGGFPCYSQNQASLSETIVTANDEIEQIQKSKSATDELLRKTASASASFTATPAENTQAHGVDNAAAPSATPTAPRSGPSDITGTNKKKDEL